MGSHSDRERPGRLAGCWGRWEGVGWEEAEHFSPDKDTAASPLSGLGSIDLGP